MVQNYYTLSSGKNFYDMSGSVVLGVTTATEQGIRDVLASAASIVSGGGRAIVYLPSTSITLTKPLPWVSGVSVVGVPPVLGYSTTLFDQDWTYVSGTRLVGDGTFPAFVPSDGTYAAYTGSSANYYDTDVTVASVTFTNTSANILVNDATMWARLSVGLFVTFTTTTAGFTAGGTYYVKTKAGTTVGVDTIITVSTTVGGAAVTATGTATASVLLDWLHYTVTNADICNIAFDTFTSAVRAGGINQAGPVNCRLENLYASNCGKITGTTATNKVTSFAFDLKNTQHVNLYKIYCNRCLGGVRMTSDVKAVVLQCGNSYMEDVYVLGTTSSLCRGIVLSASQAGSLNQIAGQRLQVNWFNRTVVTDSGTPTNGGSNFTLATPANAGRYPIGMPVTATSTVSGVTQNQTYYVLSNSGTGTGILTFANSPNTDASAITFSAATVFTISCSGYPNMECYGVTSSDKTTGHTLTGLDLEGDATTQLALYKTSGSYFNISSFGTTSNPSYVSSRGSQPNSIDCPTVDCRLDLDSSSVNTYYSGGFNSVIQSYPIGIGKDANNNVQLYLSQYGTGITWKNSSGGGYFLPTKAFGSQYTPWPYAAATLNEGSGSTIVCYSQSATSITLPTIGSGNIGWKCRIYNENTGILTVNSGASGIMNSLTGKTSFTLPGATATDVAYADVEIQTVNGTNTYLVTTGVMSIGVGSVTQLTSKSTGTTLNAAKGTVTMNGAALAATTSVTFILTNSFIAANDTVAVNIKSGATVGSYLVQVDAVGSGSCQITLRNYSAGSLSESVVLNFAVIKAN